MKVSKKRLLLGLVFSKNSLQVLAPGCRVSAGRLRVGFESER